jgi:phage gp46-like protein
MGLKEDHSRIPFLEPLKELNFWSDKFDMDRMGSRAFRIFMRCKRNGHVKIAARIYCKYSHFFPNPDDRVMALTLLMRANEK